MRLPASKTFAFVFLTAIGIIFVIPVFWILLASFRLESELVAAGGFMLLPRTWTIENFTYIFDIGSVQSPIIRWFFNSVLVSGSFSILSVLIISMSAYAFSKLRFRGRDILFLVLLFVSSFPAIVNLVPLYRIMLGLNWVNTPMALIFPGLAGVFNIFLVKQFMVGIPDSLIEAAKIDGGGEIRIYAKIILPLAKPILTIIAIFSFTGSWNDFLWPTIVMNNVENLTLTAGLQLALGQYELYTSKLSAVSVVAIFPMVIFYFCLQRYLMRGVSISAGVKG